MTDRYIIKPLVWEEVDDIFHTSPLNRVDFLIFKPEERSTSYRMSIAGVTHYGSLAEMKELAESHYRALLTGPDGPLEAVE